MSIYSEKYRLNSSKVSVILLGELENFILSEAEKYLSKAEGAKEKINFNSIKGEAFHIFISGNEESKKYSSIKEYENDKLPDGTKTVVLDFSMYKEALLHIKIQFHSSISEHPVLEISVADVKAKEVCNHLSEGIIKIVKGRGNWNCIFHNHPIQIGLLFLYALFNVINYSYIFSPEMDNPFVLAYNIIWAAALGLVVIWFLVSIFVRRYTSFDSKKEKMVSIGYYVFTAFYFALIIIYIINSYSRFQR